MLLLLNQLVIIHLAIGVYIIVVYRALDIAICLADLMRLMVVVVERRLVR